MLELLPRELIEPGDLFAAVALLALSDSSLQKKLSEFRAKQTEAVLKAAPLKL